MTTNTASAVIVLAAGAGTRMRSDTPKVLHTLAAHVKGSRTEMISNTTHPMFEQAPQRYSEIVLDFLAEA